MVCWAVSSPVDSVMCDLNVKMQAAALTKHVLNPQVVASKALLLA